jgi:hypothetical protein
MQNIAPNPAIEDEDRICLRVNGGTPQSAGGLARAAGIAAATVSSPAVRRQREGK